MNPRRLFIGSLCSALVMSGCGGDEESPTLTDSIEIVSVSPTTARAGANTEFTVNFRYSLVTVRAAVVDLGFFVDDSNQLLSGQRTAVAAGSGSGSLRATADPRSYTTSSAFAIGLLLSQDPHPESWTPLARAKQLIVVGL